MKIKLIKKKKPHKRTKNKFLAKIYGTTAVDAFAVSALKRAVVALNCT
jgi:hypothetical protein